MAGEIQIDSVTALTASGSNIVLNNVDTVTNRTNLGLGSLATQAADSVSISGGNITGGTIGSSVVFPADHVIQVVTLSTTAQSSLSNGVEFTSIRKSITPLATGSRLMITYCLGHVGASASMDLGLAPLRSTNGGSTFTEFYTGSGGTRNVLFSYTNITNIEGSTCSYTLIDPGVSTTAGSAIMYSLKAYTNTGSVYINRRGNDTTNASISTITIFELAG